MENGKTLAIVHWNYIGGGRIRLDFENYITGGKESREYKNRAAAKTAETKYCKKVARMYREA